MLSGYALIWKKKKHTCKVCKHVRKKFGILYFGQWSRSGTLRICANVFFKGCWCLYGKDVGWSSVLVGIWGAAFEVVGWFCGGFGWFGMFSRTARDGSSWLRILP